MLKTDTIANAAEDKIVIELSHAIETSEGDHTRVLVLRKPKAGDFVAVGAMPVEINLAAENLEPKFNPVAMTAFLSRLADEPPLVIKRMHPADWVKAAWEVAPFFVPGMQTSS